MGVGLPRAGLKIPWRLNSQLWPREERFVKARHEIMTKATAAGLRLGRFR